MEKNIKMSLETAKMLYKQLNNGDIQSAASISIMSIIEENFTKEELEGDEGYTWEKAFSGRGYYISIGSEIMNCTPPTHENNKNVFKTEAQAKSALAFAQLSHIVAKYNEGACKTEYLYCISNLGGGLRIDVWKEYRPVLFFYTQQDAETSLRVNRELWEQYHML